MIPPRAHLRIARLSADLTAVVKFYRDGLGFEVLHEFKDHDGFDAVMLGHKATAYHLAHLEELGHKSVKAFNPYWDKKGKTFEDPDGYRVVLHHASWTASP